MGDMISGALAVMFYGITAELALTVVIVMEIFILRPYIYTAIALIFKGEIDGKNEENVVLKRDLFYEMDISELRCQLAARDGSVPEARRATIDWYFQNREAEVVQLRRENDQLKKAVKYLAEKADVKLPTETRDNEPNDDEDDSQRVKSPV
jgi:hypothetical protein